MLYVKGPASFPHAIVPITKAKTLPRFACKIISDKICCSQVSQINRGLDFKFNYNGTRFSGIVFSVCHIVASEVGDENERGISSFKRYDKYNILNRKVELW